MFGVPRRVLLLLFFALAACRRPPARQPNVLLITLDTFRADRAGIPPLDALAREGVRFRAAGTPVPLTLPAHASILSGTLPLHHALHDNGSGVFPAGRETLATLFARRGYRTGAFVSAFVLDHRFGLDRGFQTYDDEVPRDPAANADTFEAERRGGETVDRALAWLRRPDARPWLAWVHLYDAHAPYAPPPPYPQTYDGEIRYLGAQLARLLAGVDRTSTVIAVVGDHGEALGEHGELTHGLLLYEPTLHVPMIVAAPGLAPRAVSTPVSTIDLAPTLAALAGASLTDCDGRDLDLRSGREPSPRPVYAESEYPRTFGWSAIAALRDGARKLIASPSPELFDLSGRPGETVNLLTTDRRAFRAMTAEIAALQATRVNAARAPVDAETRSKLASLGYVAPSAAMTRGAAPDPRFMAPLFRRFEEGVAALNAGRAPEAVVALAALVRDDPANPAFRATLARALRRSGDAERSLALLRESVAVAPQSADAWYDLAAALAESGRSREAAVAVDEAAKLDPRRPEIHNVRGVLLMEEGNAPAAEGEFREALRLDPRNARAANNLGNVLRAAGRDDDAAAAYRLAAQLAPRYADPLNGLGALLVQRGRGAEAVRYFDAALAVAPDFYEAELNRGIALQVAGDAAASKAALRRLLRRLPPGTAFDPQRSAARALLSRLGG